VEVCALCQEVSREAVLAFHNVRKSERVTLEIPLCEGCANRLEKHLKRAIPKRLMEFGRVAEFPVAA
jgi:protein-arginine kinase activator protein McsA